MLTDERFSMTVLPDGVVMVGDPSGAVQGPPGTDGATGAPGPTGQAGRSIQVGASVPSAATAATQQGDGWLNSLNGDLYRWDGVAWVIVGNLTGPATALDVQGTQPTVAALPATGAPGQAWIVTGPPVQLAVWSSVNSAWEPFNLAINAVPPSAAVNAGQHLIVDGQGVPRWTPVVHPPQVTHTNTPGATPQAPAGTTVPTPNEGDLFLNTHDLRMWVSQGVGWMEVLLAGANQPTVTIGVGTPQTHTFTIPVKEGDWFFDSVADGLYVYATTAGVLGWQQVASKPTAKWLTGLVDPVAGDGAVGDFWLNTTTNEIFEKVDGVWRQIVSPAVQAGATVLVGPSDPTTQQGANGDLYLNTSDHTMWVKAAGMWTKEGALTAAGTVAAVAVPYSAANAYPAGSQVTAGGVKYQASGPAAAGVAPPNAPWTIVRELPPWTVPTDAQKHLRVQPDGTLSWQDPYPIAVKATTPTAADYGEATIPNNAIWLKKV